MQEVRRFELDHMDEIVLAHEGRNAVILMHWTDGSERNYRDVPVKLVFYVTDPAGVAERLRAAGGEITHPPAPNAAMGGAIIAMGKDPDGYVVELIQAPGSGG